MATQPSKNAQSHAKRQDITKRGPPAPPGKPTLTLLGIPREIRDQIFGYLFPPITENSIVVTTVRGGRLIGLIPEENLELLIQGLKFNPLEISTDIVDAQVDYISQQAKMQHRNIMNSFGFIHPGPIGYLSTKLAIDGVHGSTRTRAIPYKWFKDDCLLNVSQQIRDELCDMLFKGRRAHIQGYIEEVTRTFCFMPPWLLPFMEDISLCLLGTRSTIECIKNPTDQSSLCINVLLYIWQNHCKVKSLSIGDEYMTDGFSDGFSGVVLLLAKVQSLKVIRIQCPIHTIPRSCLNVENRGKELEDFLQRVHPTWVRFVPSNSIGEEHVFLRRA